MSGSVLYLFGVVLVVGTICNVTTSTTQNDTTTGTVVVEGVGSSVPFQSCSLKTLPKGDVIKSEVGSVLAESIPVGSFVVVQCPQPFTEELYAFCLPGGVWSPLPSRCPISNGTECIIPNVYSDKDLKWFKLSDTNYKVTCESQFSLLIGTEFYKCEGGKWSPRIIPRCVPRMVRCQRPIDLVLDRCLSPNCDFFYVSSVAKFQCSLNSDLSVYRICSQNGTWYPDLPADCVSDPSTLNPLITTLAWILIPCAFLIILILAFTLTVVTYKRLAVHAPTRRTSRSSLHRHLEELESRGLSRDDRICLILPHNPPSYEEVVAEGPAADSPTPHPSRRSSRRGDLDTLSTATAASLPVTAFRGSMETMALSDGTSVTLPTMDSTSNPSLNSSTRPMCGSMGKPADTDPLI